MSISRLEFVVPTRIPGAGSLGLVWAIGIVINGSSQAEIGEFEKIIWWG
jgi:hypothetical protein